jgi:PAS domain S-box-containing protein
MAKTQRITSPWPRQRSFIVPFTLWTVLIAAVLTTLFATFSREEREIALNRAKDSFQKDLVYRRWAAERGGVYVPMDAATPPNPYLAHVPNRDITTTEGKRLTLVNPAYMTRMVHELDQGSAGIRGHITSLRPLRPENGPDGWERKALESFEQGQREYAEMIRLDGKPVLRYMGAFLVEKSCLACHGQQGYKVGDVRGGLSITVPIGTTPAVLSPTLRTTSTLVIVAFWGLGSLGLWMWVQRRRKNDLEQTHLIEELGISSSRFESLQLTTPDGLLFVDNLGFIRWANDNYCHLSGYNREDLLGASLTLVECADSDAVIRQRIARIHLGETRRFRTQHRTKDGRVLDLEVTPASLPPGNEIITFLRDITEDLKSAKHVQESEARFRMVFESSPVPMFIHREGRILLANGAGAKLLGAETPEALVGLEFMPFVHPDFRDFVAQRAEAIPAEGTALALTEECFINLQGQEVWAEVQAVALNLLGVPAKLVFALDVTERRKSEAERLLLEQEIQHTQKLESLGSLAGGIAHDMNNVLGAILGMSSLLQMKHEGDQALSKSLRTIEDAATRGRDLVKGLTDFARKGLNETRAVDLNALILQDVELLKHSTLQRFAFELHLAENLPTVQGESSTLSSAFMNLCVNAFDAMPTGGTLTVTTRSSNGHVILSVRDTGEGIPADILPRITEPFFTTKAMGRGTGLGLAMVYGTVKAHGGSLDIESEVGKGTCVTLTLPMGEAHSASHAPLVSESASSQRTLRILVVDDDALVRSVLPDMIEHLGHRVATASSALEAIRRLTAGMEVDLIILDHNMPGMTGADALPRIMQLRPEARILIATGFLDQEVKMILLQFPAVQALQKPFTVNDLRRLIEPE